LTFFEFFKGSSFRQQVTYHLTSKNQKILHVYSVAKSFMLALFSLNITKWFIRQKEDSNATHAPKILKPATT
jgi:hypothetical protein